MSQLWKIDVQWQLPGAEDLDEDIAINTFWFAGPDGDTITDAGTELQPWIIEFFMDPPGSLTPPIDFLGYVMSVDPVVRLVKVNPLTGLEIGAAVEGGWDPGSVLVTGQMPTEVALCVSYAAVPVFGIPRASTRGRIYMGPFDTTAASSNGRPITSLIESLAGSAKQLADHGLTSDYAWVIYSRTQNDFYPVASGWVDNEWDTQRRRGRLATARETWVQG